MTLPTSFLWTHFGTEAGETLGAILARKNFERTRNDGTFTWGIGSALGTSVNALRAEHADGPPALFSPIASPPASVDVAPTDVIAWRAYLDDNQRHIPLPPGAFISSRAPHHGDLTLARHWALFCHSRQPLAIDDFGTIDIGQLANLTTGNAIGSSQTTCVVRHRPDAAPLRSYPVAIRANLAEPHFARLADPILLTSEDRSALVSIADAAAYAAFVDDIFGRKTTSTLPLQSSLF